MPLKKRRHQANAGDQFDHEEEDEVPEDAFEIYYNTHSQDEESDRGDSCLEKNLAKSPEEIFSEEVTRGFYTWIYVSAWTKESRKLLKIAVPSTFSTISSSVLDAIVVAMISVELGGEAYLACCLIAVFLGITDTFIGGIEDAESILTAQAVGMGNSFLAGQYYQLSTLLYIIFAIPTYGMWIYYTEWVILSLGLPEVIAELAGEYVPIAAVSYFINGLAGSLSTLMWSAEYGTSMTVIDTLFHVLYVGAIWVAIFVYDLRDLVSIAWIGIAYGFVYGLFMFSYVFWNGLLDPYKKGMFRNLALKNIKLVRGVLKMAVPLSLGSLMSYGEWEIFTYFSITMGPAEVAAWQLAGAIWRIFEYMPGGFGYAAELRVAFHLGNGNPCMAKIAAYKSLLYSLWWITIVTAIFVYYSDSIVAFFTSDPTLTIMLKQIVTLISVGNIFLCIGSESYYILSAQSRTNISTVIYFVCTWLVTLPLATYFVHFQNYGLQSVVTSIIIGYAASSTVLLYAVFTSNWAKISKKIIRKAKETEEYCPKKTYVVPEVPIV